MFLSPSPHLSLILLSLIAIMVINVKKELTFKAAPTDQPLTCGYVNLFMTIMNNLLKQQYVLLKESREVVFNFLETEVKHDTLHTVPEFNNKTIIYMLVHTANTYLAWVDIFALKSERDYYDENNITSMTRIRQIFGEIDGIIGQFLATFKEDPYKRVSGFKWQDKFIETDALAIFTHVITHESHHKGQIMTMCRLLGHTPPDTDIMRF